MTNLGIIMTTDIRIASTFDISKGNEIINLAREFNVGGVVLSAASYSVSTEVKKPLAFVLTFIYKAIVGKFPHYDVWLFLGNSATQPDTRMVRYKRLWGALRSRGFDIPGSNEFLEAMVEVSGGLKFFGAVLLSELSIETVADVVIDERCSYIVALPKKINVLNALDMGWSGEMSKDFERLRCVSKKKGIVFKRVGEFDDDERGFTAIALPKIIKELLV
ncbi:hypothetical protein A244_18343 [Pseudomonas syringae pv. actinidiae ICMP 18807]|uniref:Uncharacterized protein n=3 Tax=Pseudomonas syringae TaxID=317 RepID=S6V9W9_PSESF|nr:hypothetical protein A244_18343 [Pseudomonas syringae pv. actinidiae ICMP 18807]